MTDTKAPRRIPRAIEDSFPIVEINRLAVPERNAFKPIYRISRISSFEGTSRSAIDFL